MTYRERQRLTDIQAAIDAIRSHLRRGDLSDGLIFDAVRIRLLEIGEAVKALPTEMLGSQPDIPWTQIARMRDLGVAHRHKTALSSRWAWYPTQEPAGKVVWCEIEALSPTRRGVGEGAGTTVRSDK